MSGIKRREAREIVVSLLFETEFKDGESVAEIYDLSSDNREIPEDEGLVIDVNGDLHIVSPMTEAEYAKLEVPVMQSFAFGSSNFLVSSTASFIATLLGIFSSKSIS